MITQLLNHLTASGIVSPSDLHGASEGDIALLEEWGGVRLPRSYKTFLGLVGRGAGKFLRSDHWSFTVDSLPGLNTTARPLLAAANLRGPWFCFATRIGEVYLFFLADGANDNPPVYCWNEELDPRIEKGFESFDDWLKSIIDDYQSWKSTGE